MAAAAALVDRLLRRLASGSRRLELPPNVDEQVGHVWRTMSRLRDVVVSLESQFFRVRTEVQDWMRKIDQIVYDLEDLLDEFEDQDSVGSSGCAAKATPFFSSSPFLLHSTRGDRMKTLRKRLDVLAKDSVIFNLMQHSRCDLEQSDNQEEYYRAATIGRDNDKTKIKESILQNDAETLSIIPIVGPVGLGKTTLARLIFRDQEEAWNFDLRIWVDLNRKFDLKKIAADIISQANETKEEGPSAVNTNIAVHENLQLLKNRLQAVFHDRSCLIVLDGLCSTDKIKLDELKDMLRSTNKCIKILVTTSNEITAELMHTVPPYKLLPLSDDDCWAIFSQKAFEDGDAVNGFLKRIGKQIVKRCEGIPALAHSLGSIVHNEVMAVWLAARDEEMWKLDRRYSTKIDLFSPFNQIWDMPSALKLCFLYLSIFPKGSVIDKEKLIHQWIALDMIGSKHETLSSYVHGEMFIQDLLSIYFLQVRKTHLVFSDVTWASEQSDCRSFSVFCIFVCSCFIACKIKKQTSPFNCRGWLEVYGFVGSWDLRLLHFSVSLGILSPHRLLFSDSTGAINIALDPMKHEVTKYIEVDASYMRPLVQDQIVVLHYVPSKLQLLTSSRRLETRTDSSTFSQRLQHSVVNGTENRTAPTTLYMHNFAHDFARHVSCNDTIILDGTEKSGYAKSPTFHYALLTFYRGQSTLCSSLLTRARALHFRNIEALMLHREAFKLLKHLRVLNLSGSCIGEIPASIGQLKHLRYLDLSDLNIQALPYSMSMLTNLEALDLSNTSLKELPSFVGTLWKLKYLNLQGCHILQNLPPTLGHLQRLEHLRLSCCYDVGELADSLCNVQDLRVLDLSSCTELRLLPPLFGDLINLENLNLSGCFNIKQLPESFGNLYFLRFLNISSCYELLQLPESLSNLSKLEVLILRRCRRLQILPPSFGNIQYLRILDLAGCEALHVSTEMLTTNLQHLNLQQCRKLHIQPNCFENFTKLTFLNLSQCHPNIDYLLNPPHRLPNIDAFQSLGHLIDLEYLNLSQTILDIPVSFERLQKLHTLDLTGSVLMHPASGIPQILRDTIGKMTGLKFVLTKDPMIMDSLPQHIRCSVGSDEDCRITTDELVVPDLTGGSRGLGIAERVNMQNQCELRFLKLEWMPAAQLAAGDVVEDIGEEEVLEKLEPNQSLEHFELVGYSGSVFSTWMMCNIMTSLPNLVSLHLFHLENCKDLPPLGELRNLRYLHIKDVPNLTSLQMGLSGGPQPFKKLTHLKLESLFNLEELSILLVTRSDDHYMFPTLEELSVVSCCKLMFEPSLPKCLKYEIRESNRVLSCGEPIGPSSSSPPVQIEITGCMIPSSLFHWIRSLKTLEKAVIDACMGEDGQLLTSLGLLEIMDEEEQPNSYAAHETTTVSPLERIVLHESTTEVGAPTDTGHSGFPNRFPWLRTSPTHKELLASVSFSGSDSTTSEDLSTISTSTFSLDSPNLKVFSFAELKTATKNFRPGSFIGEGVNGRVYKGWLHGKLNPSKISGGMVVAIKKFNPKSLTENWQNEIKFLGGFAHPTLVKLLGYCLDDNNTAFVFEFMAKGSLENHLFGRTANLSWSLRIKILIGAARGLAFLHSLERPIIHRNFKTSKILLDSNFNAKLSSLGCARIGPDIGVSHVTTRVMGTYGHAAPEYVATGIFIGHLYVKSDVYSFGVVLLEVLSGRRSVDRNRPRGELSLVDWAKPYLHIPRRRLHRVMDPRLMGEYSSKGALQAAQLALRCLSNDHRTRPSMNEAKEVLESIASMDTKTR